MKNKTTFYITSWDDVHFTATKNILLAQGVNPKYIFRIADRASRPKAMNKAWNTCDTQYIAFLDDDIKVCEGEIVSRMEYILDTDPNIGCAVIPCAQYSYFPEKIIPQMPHGTPLEKALVNTSRELTTLNFVLIRNNLPNALKFDEDFFGNQVFDVDFGWGLLKNNLLCVEDTSLALAHIQTDYPSKNLFYHAAVARNKHILKEKWSNIDQWVNLAHFNLHNNNAIPSIEELSHTNEKKLIEYIASFNRHGFIKAFLEPRFAGVDIVQKYLASLEDYTNNTEDIFNYTFAASTSLPIFDQPS